MQLQRRKVNEATQQFLSDPEIYDQSLKVEGTGRVARHGFIYHLCCLCLQNVLPKIHHDFLEIQNDNTIISLLLPLFHEGGRNHDPNQPYKSQEAFQVSSGNHEKATPHCYLSSIYKGRGKRGSEYLWLQSLFTLFIRSSAQQH